MPSSKSSIDHRDVYYRLTKSTGYRARSAYKLIHLDEEFGLFEGVDTAVDLCAAPGSWSQVLIQRLKSSDNAKIVALDLQPMAPLPGVHTLQADITQPATVPRVLEALGGRKADLIVCDGAPDVTGVHDLDAYLHSQLLLAAITLSLLLLAPHGTLVMKVFLSPLDPKAAMLQSQLRSFFPGDLFGTAYDEMVEDEVEEIPASDFSQSGVYVRKPRSSRQGSGEAFVICRDFDASRLPWPSSFGSSDLAALSQQTGSLSLMSLERVLPNFHPSKEWEALKAYVSSGDLDLLPSSEQMTAANGDHSSSKSSPTDPSQLRSITGPIVTEPEETTEPINESPTNSKTSPRISRSHESLGSTGRSWINTQSRSSSLASTSPSTATLDVPWDHRPTPLPSPALGHEGENRNIPSPAPSTSSKNDLFFQSTDDPRPKPPKLLSRDNSIRTQGDLSTPRLPLRLPHQGHKKTISTELKRPFTALPTRSLSQGYPSGPPVSERRPKPAPSQHPPQREHREIADSPRFASEDVLSDGPRSWVLGTRLGDGAFSSVWSTTLQSDPTTIFAIKLTSRDACAEDARTKVAFLREVSVLRHISHPNIVSYEASFSTPTHHCLVLERLSGGELYELLINDTRRKHLSWPSQEDPAGEGLARRVFGELVKAVGWLHTVGIVHRDIKLENVLFTIDPFSVCPLTERIPLDRLPTPLVKLTDFGLSRFIDLTDPVLETRCGSESFAAPEIIMGKKYDGRETDCWALGVILYALVVGQLPFDGEEEGRRRKMMRIAKADYAWPEGVGSRNVRDLTRALLVRDPKKRATATRIWEYGWMKGPGEVSRTLEQTSGGERRGSRRVLDGYLLDEEVSADASAEMDR